MAVRQATKFDFDDLAAQDFSGFVSGFIGKVSTRRYIDAVMDDITTDLGVRFNMSVDRQAELDEVSWQHVYESGDVYPGSERSDTIGNPTQRLWWLHFTGSGGARTVSFSFRPSDQPVPIHPELLKAGGKKNRSVLSGVHVFTWKAPIMEYGITVSISPQLSPKKFLAFYHDEDKKIVFTQKTIRAVPGEMRDNHSSVGKFTGWFKYWWAAEATSILNSEILPQLERETFTQKDVNMGVASRYRTGAKKIVTETDRRMAFKKAEQRAIKEWEGRAHSHINEAKARRLDLYGY